MRRIPVLRIIALATIVIILSSFPVVAFAKEPTDTIKYTVRQGDTLYLLAVRFGTTTEGISSMNKRFNPDNLLIGQKITIPVGKDIIINPIKSGDSLWKIAQKYNSTIETITAQNYIKNSDLIYKGDSLAIPKDKKVVRLSGEGIEGLGKHRVYLKVTQADYDGAYALYTSNSIEQLNKTIEDIKIKMAQPQTNNLGQPLIDESGFTEPKGGAIYNIDDQKGGYVKIAYNSIDSMSGTWFALYRFSGTVNTVGDGFTNGIPVNVEKFIKALLVYSYNTYK